MLTGQKLYTSIRYQSMVMVVSELTQSWMWSISSVVFSPTTVLRYVTAPRDPRQLKIPPLIELSEMRQSQRVLMAANTASCSTDRIL